MKRIPITLITGFLGSGKSTFINSILKKYPQKKFALILNEFGDVKLESSIVKSTEDQVVELSNGCMCCVARSDILDAVLELLEKQPDTEHILIEASGLSDPIPIGRVFANMLPLTGKEIILHLDTVLCIIDMEHFLQTRKKYAIVDHQVRSADFILLSKKTSIEDEHLIRDHIKLLVPKAHIHSAQEAPFGILLDSSDADHSKVSNLDKQFKSVYKNEHHSNHDDNHQDHPQQGYEGHTHENSNHHDHHHEHVDTLFFKTNKPLSYQMLKKAIVSLPSELARAKGILHFKDSYLTDKKFILQIVGAREDVIVNEWGENEERQTAIVFIGKGMDTDKIEAAMRSCETE